MSFVSSMFILVFWSPRLVFARSLSCVASISCYFAAFRDRMINVNIFKRLRNVHAHQRVINVYGVEINEKQQHTLMRSDEMRMGRRSRARRMGRGTNKFPERYKFIKCDCRHTRTVDVYTFVVLLFLIGFAINSNTQHNKWVWSRAHTMRPK